MRLPRVVASASLIVALAMVVIPGSVGSATPRAPEAIDPAALQAVQAPAPTRMTTAATTLDASYRAAAALDVTDPVVEPGIAFAAPVRGTVRNPAAPVAFVPIATPKPKPKPRTVPKAAPAPAPPSSGGGGGGGGGSGDDWRDDPEISWFGPGLYGNRTACGQTLTKELVGVAHRWFPCGTKVTFKHGSRVVTVPVIDRGPYVEGRIFDLSRGACVALNHCFTGPIQWRLP